MGVAKVYQGKHYCACVYTTPFILLS